jgi:hypothetical protein
VLEGVAVDNGKVVVIKWVEHRHQRTARNGERVVFDFGLVIAETGRQDQITRDRVIDLQFDAVANAFVRIQQ